MFAVEVRCSNVSSSTVDCCSSMVLVLSISGNSGELKLERGEVVFIFVVDRASVLIGKVDDATAMVAVILLRRDLMVLLEFNYEIKWSTETVNDVAIELSFVGCASFVLNDTVSSM